MVSFNIDFALRAINLARSSLSVSRCVLVIRLKLLLVTLKILKSGMFISTIATVYGSNTRDELLLGERKELSRFNEVSALDSGGYRESPARSTISLVFDTVNCTLLSPILRFRINRVQSHDI